MFLILIHVCNVYHNIFWPFNYQVNNDLPYFQLLFIHSLQPKPNFQEYTVSIMCRLLRSLFNLLVHESLTYLMSLISVYFNKFYNYVA